MNDLAKNIISMGAHGRVKKALNPYEDAQSVLLAAHKESEVCRKSTNGRLEGLLQSKLMAVSQVKRLELLRLNVHIKVRQLTSHSIDHAPLAPEMRQIKNTIESAQSAMDAAKGTGAGISTALGTWALVGTFGTASTGTAIATLSGAAASNATLAWLGGGALAAGGGGMAAGTLVLGGLIAVPALIVLGAFNHVRAGKQIAEIERCTLEAVRSTAECKAQSIKLKSLGKRALELDETIQRTTRIFTSQYDAMMLVIFPWGPMSKFKRYCWRLFGRPFYSSQDLAVIAPLVQIAGSLSDLIDTKLMTADGELL